MRSAALALLLTLGVAAGCSVGGTKTVAVTVTATTTVELTTTKPVPVKPPTTVYVPQAGGGVEYKPPEIFVGASGGAFTDIRWRTYGSSPAIADAKVPHNDCVPSCAGGHITTTTVTIWLTRIAPCKGVPAYSTAEVIKSSNPDEEGNSTDLGALCAEGG